MDRAAVDGYLARLGTERPGRAGDDALRELQLHHLRAIPFENLSIHLGEPIVLDEAALVDKLVRRRRGGFCYELNGAFAGLLRALGFRVTMLQARVYGAGGLGIPYDHMALRVDATETWLADVGFGRHCHYPLRLDDRGDQPDPGGIFRVVAAEQGDLDILRDGEPQFRLDLRPRALADFEAGCWWHQTSPRSHFTRSLVCSRLTERGRITLTGRQLVETEEGGPRRERALGSDAEVLEAYRAHFGISLERVPVVLPR